MRTVETIRDFDKRIIGYIETDDKTGDKIAKDFYKRILGYYDAKLNVTRDFYKVIVARGDAAVGLIWANDAKEKAEKASKK